MAADGRGPEGRFVDADDERYHLHEFGAGAPTVFLHGGGPGCTGWTDFGPVAPRFARRPAGRARRPPAVRAQLEARDRRARCGTSTRATSSRCSTRSGSSRPDLVCNSWGGTMALCLAATHPDRVGVAGRDRLDAGVPRAAAPAARAAPARSHRPRAVLRRRRPVPRQDARPHGAARVVRRRRHPRRRPSTCGTARASRPTRSRCGQSPTDRGEWQDLADDLRRDRAHRRCSCGACTTRS